MKNIIFFLFLLQISSLSFAQERFMVVSENGLIGREQPNVNGDRKAKLVYGSIVEILERTGVKMSVSDDSGVVHGEWVKVTFNNFPFMNSEKNIEDFHDTAYVFNGFLKSIESAQIDFKDLDKPEFEKLKKIAKASDPKSPEIKDFKRVQKLLKDRVKWRHYVNGFYFPESIVLSDGRILKTNLRSWDVGFISYFPNEEILFFEGGHSSDFSLSLRTGEYIETVGSPAYFVTSPNGKYRFNAKFPGQECYDYFIQKRVGLAFQNITNFGWDQKYEKNLCTFDFLGWISDKEFIFKYKVYSSDKPVEVLRQGTIREK